MCDKGSGVSAGILKPNSISLAQQQQPKTFSCVRMNDFSVAIEWWRCPPCPCWGLRVLKSSSRYSEKPWLIYASVYLCCKCDNLIIYVWLNICVCACTCACVNILCICSVEKRHSDTFLFSSGFVWKPHGVASGGLVSEDGCRIAFVSLTSWHIALL